MGGFATASFSAVPTSFYDATTPVLHWTGSVLEIYAGQGSAVERLALTGGTLSYVATFNTVASDSYVSLTAQGGARAIEARHLDQLEASAGATARGELAFGGQSGLMSDALTLMAVDHNGQTLFVSALWGHDGLSLAQRNGSSLQVLDAESDTTSSYAQQVTALASWSYNDRSFVFAGSIFDRGVSSYEIVGTSLSLADSLGVDDGVAFNTPTSLAVTEVAGQAYLLVSDAGLGQISVLSISAAGGLDLVSTAMDDLSTRFSGVTAFDVAEVNGHVFVVAGGTDGGVSLLRLLPNGQLVHVDTLVDTANLWLEDISALQLVETGGTLHVFVTSEDASGVTHLTIDTATLGQALNGTSGANVLVGTDDDDQLWAGKNGNDTLSGGAGDDLLIADRGQNVLSGGAGADLFVAGSRTTDMEILDFAVGVDLIDLSAWPFLYSVAQVDIQSLSDGARISFSGREITLRTDDGTSLSYEDFIINDILGLYRPPLPEPDSVVLDDTDASNTLVGVAGNDTLIGNGGSDTLNGRDGDDLLEGGDDSDVVFGGKGADTLMGDASHDALVGEDGNDMIYGGAGADTLDGGQGSDTLFGDSSVDSLSGGDGADSLTGGTGADTIWGGNGNDTIFSNTGEDIMYGEAGHDYISAGNGVDIADGGAGDDTIIGRSGWDTLHGGADDDHLYGSEGSDELTGGTGDDYVSGGTGFDVLYGNSGNDSLYGNQGNDFLSGGSGDDALYGATGNDILYGRSGNDDLFGNQGNDTLDGGSGSDVLQGGSLADTFVFEVDHGRDKITDFEVGVDILQLSSALVAGLGTGEDIVDAFATFALGRVRLEFSEEDWIALDGVTDLAAVAAAIEIF
ncbi:MAG: hypothetical protein AAGL96_10455 [Pseudomonadota bacterium]